MTPKEAYKKALEEGPSDETRNIVKRSSKYSILYASFVDFAPHPVTRKGACQNPKYAYIYAYKVDQGPRDDTRKAVLKEPSYSFFYARDVDKQPRDDTREAASKDSYYAYAYMVKVDKKHHPVTYRSIIEGKDAKLLYLTGEFLGFSDEIKNRIFELSAFYSLMVAKLIDKKPSDKSKKAVLGSPECAYLYSRDILRKPDDELRNAACQKAEYAYYYARDVDRCPRDDTRISACQNPVFAYKYALYVDKRPTDITRNSVVGDSEYAYRYARDVDRGYHPVTYNAVLNSNDSHSKLSYVSIILRKDDPNMYQSIKSSYSSGPQLRAYEKYFILEPTAMAILKGTSELSVIDQFIKCLGLLNSDEEKVLINRYRSNVYDYFEKSLHIDVESLGELLECESSKYEHVRDALSAAFEYDFDILLQRLKSKLYKSLKSVL